MSKNDQEIKACPRCNSAKIGRQLSACLGQQTPRHMRFCTCGVSAGWHDNDTDAIRAWNQLALAFGIARATALQFAAESAAWDDENTTQQQHDKCLMVEQDAANSLSALLEKWRQTDG